MDYDNDWLDDDQMSDIDVAREAMKAGKTDWKTLTAGVDLEALPAIFDMWCIALDEFEVSIDLDDYAEALMQAWVLPRSPLSSIFPEDWIYAFDHVGFRIDGQRADRPTKPVTLYRGGEDRMGMSWTPDRSVAEHFASATYSSLWTCEVPPEAILAIFRNGEEEYVINTDELCYGDIVEI